MPLCAVCPPPAAGAAGESSQRLWRAGPKVAQGRHPTHPECHSAHTQHQNLPQHHPEELESLRAATVRREPANANANPNSNPNRDPDPNPEPSQTQTTPSTPTPSGFAKLFGRGAAGKRHHKQTASAHLPPEVFGDRRPRNATTAGMGDENCKRAGAEHCASGRDAAFSKSAPQSRKMSAVANGGLIEAFSEQLGAEDSSRGSEHDDASLEEGNERARGPAESSTPTGTLTKQKSLDRGTDEASLGDMRLRMPRSATGYSREERLKQTALLKFKFLNEFDALPADSDLPGAMPLDSSALQTTNLYGTMSRSALQYLRSSLESSPPQAQAQAQAQLQANHNVSHSRSGSDVPPQPQSHRRCVAAPL